MSAPERVSSRDRLIHAAARLFYEHGIHSTGIDAIVQAAQLTKPTLYAHFRSKNDLVTAVIEYRSDNWKRALTARVEAANTPHGKLMAVFEFLEDFVGDEGFRGCALVNAAVEIPGPLDPGRETARRNKGWNRELLERLARDAGLRDPDDLAACLALLFEGAIVTAYVEGDETAGNAARRAAEQLIAAHR